jgi:ribosomal protein L11 methyltransferase
MQPAARTLVLTVPPPDAELAGDRLWAAGAAAIEERDAIDGRVELRTVLAADDSISLQRLGDVPGEWQVSFVDVDAAPAETWRDHAAPITIAPDLIIRPAWLERVNSPGVTEVEIEPGASFGLGDHPTTRLSAAAVWRSSPVHVLDVGCGSGVLAIVAALRGAERVVAIDIAEAAHEATTDNADRNGVGDRIAASTAPIGDVEGQFDLVLANILAPTLVALSTDLRRVTAPGGTLVISGVLAEHHDQVLAALAPFEVVRSDRLDGWAAVELRAPSASQ